MLCWWCCESGGDVTSITLHSQTHHIVKVWRSFGNSLFSQFVQIGLGHRLNPLWGGNVQLGRNRFWVSRVVE